MKINLHLNNVNFGTSCYINPKNYIKEDRMVDTFVKAVKIDSASDDSLASEKCPTTEGQLEVARYLADELKTIGLEGVEIDDNGFVFATLNSNVDNAPTVGFIAHMDVSPDCDSKGVKPIVHNYKGGDIVIGEQTISKDELNDYVNHKIITSDGRTLLGADDKAGIAEIVEALRVFVENPDLKRPKIKVAFTPDEEIGTGVDMFNVDKFKADVAYTVDGTKPFSLDTETFNAYSPIIKIKGVSSHYGDAYGKMVNALLIANELINKLPKDETPETTKDRQGYYCVDKIQGNSDAVTLKLALRDFDSDGMKMRLDVVSDIIKDLKEKYPKAKFEFNENPLYKNMKDYFGDIPEIIDYAKRGIELTGIKPTETSIRGGTDGSTLTEMGLPCPNLGTGAVNFHTPKEFVSVDEMKLCCENIINIAQVWANEENPFK